MNRKVTGSVESVLEISLLFVVTASSFDHWYQIELEYVKTPKNRYIYNTK